MKFYGIDFKEPGNNNIETYKRLAQGYFFNVFNTDYQAIVQDLKNVQQEPIETVKKLVTMQNDCLMDLKNAKSGFSNLISQEGLVKRIEVWEGFFSTLEFDEINELFNFWHIDLTKGALLKIKRNKQKEKLQSPVGIKSLLDQYVIGQDIAKQYLSTVFYTYLLKTRKVKPAIHSANKGLKASHIDMLQNSLLLLIGPTGCGKTFMVKTLCKLFDFPFVKVDCSSLVSSGYVGMNISSYVFKLYNQIVKNNPMGILYFDEIDKISEIHTQESGSVGGVEVQQELLKLIEGEDMTFNIPRKNSANDCFELDMSQILIILSGSFHGIESIIERRIGKNMIGYGQNSNKKDEALNIFEHIMPVDFQSFGIIQELAGRLENIVSLNPLSKEDIKRIMLHSEKSPLLPYFGYFGMHYDSLKFEEEVYDLIAEKVLEYGTGARAIKSVLHKLLGKFMFNAPNLKKEEFIVDKKYFFSVFK